MADTKGEYQKVPTDPEKLIDAPPAYSIPIGDEEHLIRVGSEVPSEDESCTPGKLCFASVMAAFCCFWPAALVGMMASMKARYADNEAARRYLRIGKKFVWASFIIGLVAMVVVAGIQLGITAHVLKKTWRGTMRGYVAGTEDGMHKGSEDAVTMIAVGARKLPEYIPGSANLLDINSGFWTQMSEVESPKEAGYLVGHAFGYVDGYKKGFCSVDGTDCSGVSLVTFADRVITCPRMRAKLERMQSKHEQKMGDDDDDDDDDEHSVRHNMKHGQMGKKKCNKHNQEAFATLGVEGADGHDN